MVRGGRHTRTEGARQAAASDRALQARGVRVDPGAPAAESAVAVEDRATVLEAGKAEQVSLRGALTAPRAASERLAQESSASPVGSDASTAGSSASPASPSAPSITASPLASASTASNASSNSCSSSSSEPVRTVTSSVS